MRAVRFLECVWTAAHDKEQSLEGANIRHLAICHDVVNCSQVTMESVGICGLANVQSSVGGVSQSILRVLNERVRMVSAN